MKTLLIGYGNPIRSDDGVGLYIAREIEKLHLPALEVRTSQQLQIELAEDLLQYKRVIFADASSDGPVVTIRKLESATGNDGASSHHLNPEVLQSVVKALYKKAPEFYICAVRGENFELGEEISSVVLERATEAIDKIRRLVFEKPRIL